MPWFQVLGRNAWDEFINYVRVSSCPPSIVVFNKLFTILMYIYIYTYISLRMDGIEIDKNQKIVC